MTQPQHQTPAGSGLEPLEWSDEVRMNAYRSALEKALESSDGACGTILTSCFSLATAYGAVIALVAPKDEQAPLLVVLPFVLLALGAVVALLGKSTGISLSEKAETTGEVRSVITTAVNDKRRASWFAIGLAAAGVVLAGYVVLRTYGHSSEVTLDSSEVVLSSVGKANVAGACGQSTESLTGEATVTKRWITIAIADAAQESCGGIETLTLPASWVAFTRSAP